MKAYSKLIFFAFICLVCSCQPADAYLNLVGDDPDHLVYTSEGQSVRLKLSSSRSWKAACTESWIEIQTPKGDAAEEQNFKFSLSPNIVAKNRTGEITITAGSETLVLTVIQQAPLVYYLKENFDRDNLIYVGELPSGWYSLDADQDGNGWHCVRDPETQETFAWSYSYDDYSGALEPDNWLVTPRFNFPEPGVSLRWDSRGSDPEYLGDKYEVWVARYEDGGNLQRMEKLCEETVDSATELKHHQYSLDKYDNITICIAFRHFDSKGLGGILITNVEVSNRL